MQHEPVFSGLRVRMTMHTDIPAAITIHAITQKVMYQGSVHDVADALTECARGGQVALSAASFGRLTLDPVKYFHSKKQLQVLLAASRKNAMRRDSVALKAWDRVFR
jgi:hypothetical protein